MPESYLIEYCAPTLAGIKTGSLFSFETNSEEESNKEIIKLNRLFRKKGLRAIPLKRNNKRTLLYLYRPNYLAKDLKKLEVKETSKWIIDNNIPRFNEDRDYIEKLVYPVEEE